MNENAGLPQADPLKGSTIAGRWSFGYDVPDKLGGGFVAGELLLRTDGVLLRRYGGSSYRAGQVTWKYGPWDEVTWWTGETNPQQAVALLKSRGYDLLKHDPVPIDKPTFGPPPARLPPASPCKSKTAETSQPDDQLFRWPPAEQQPGRHLAQRRCYRRPTFDPSR